LFLFILALLPNAGHSLLIHEVSWSHTTTQGSQSVELPLNEWSARRRDLYLTTHNTHKKQTSMPPAGFEPTISADERLQEHNIRLDFKRMCWEVGPCECGVKRLVFVLVMLNQWILLPDNLLVINSC